MVMNKEAELRHNLKYVQEYGFFSETENGPYDCRLEQKHVLAILELIDRFQQENRVCDYATEGQSCGEPIYCGGLWVCHTHEIQLMEEVT